MFQISNDNMNVYFVFLSLLLHVGTRVTGQYTTYTSAIEETTVTGGGNCCAGLQDQIADLTAQVLSLQSTVDSLENRLSEVENTLNITDDLNTCDGYRRAGYDSGYYTIDIDGANGNLEPFQVYCDMDSDPDLAITMLGHDSEERTFVNGCQDPGCYSKNVTYNQSDSQIRAMVLSSQTCQQYLSYECLNSMLFNYYDYAWWVDRNGTSQFYWPGADPGSRMCACGKAGTCDGKATTCNCDNNDNVWRQDDGYLTEKEKLPVSQLNFGDVLGIEERGFFTLGRLECKGQVSITDCAGIKKAGNPSGYYTISPDSRVEPFTVYCDMDSYPGTGISVVHHDTEQQVALDAYYDGTTDVYVTYQNATMDQIVALMENSDNCEQYIEWRCDTTGMLYGGYTWWVSRQGDKMNYWGGANPEHDGYCACGETGTCQPNNNYAYKCNCDDTSTGYWRVDGGNLYDKRTLPVSAMHFGFYYPSSSYDGYYTLGPLKCY